MQPSPIRHRIALVLALLGAALAAYALEVGMQLAADSGFTSICNLGGVVNCDVVLTSRFSHLLGLPVSVWALLAFGAGALLALPGALGRPQAFADLLLLALTSGSVGFAAVLAGAMATLGSVCLICLSMDVVIAAWFVTVLPLARRFALGAPAPWWRRRTAATAAAAVALVVAIAAGTVAAVVGPATALTYEDVKTHDPAFHDWYTRLPVRPTATLVGSAAHRKGPSDAAVSIVEFSDFQCPHCAQAYKDLRDLCASRSDVALVFRHFPLDAACNRRVTGSGHPDACLAACAAECAAKQDRFWSYHDVLFENQKNLDRSSLFRYARDVGLDLDAFRSCLDAPETRALVSADVEAGAAAGVASTPTLFINGRTIQGALRHEHYDYALIIERHLRTPRGTAGAS
jgi:protein-disulfide isomerase